MDMEKALAILSRPLTPKEIEWRVQKANTKNGTKVTSAIIVPYITKTSVRRRLNEAFGLHWQVTYTDLTVTVPKGRSWVEAPAIEATISVYDGAQWIHRSDRAEPTQFEPIKGGVSDAFKRAGGAWGIGLELNEMPIVWADISPTAKPGYSYASAKKDQGRLIHDAYYWKPPAPWDGGIVSIDQVVEPDESKVISSEQRKIITDFAKVISKQKVMTVLDDFGYEATAEVTTDDFQEIVETLQAIANQVNSQNAMPMLITSGQRKSITDFTASDPPLAKDEIIEILESFGFNSTAEVTTDKYEDIIAVLEVAQSEKMD